MNETILRKHPKSGFTTVSNDLLFVKGMSHRAIGLAVRLLSKQDDWIIRIDYLAKVGKEGKQAVRTALQELATFGFLMRERIYIDGKVRTITHIADYPAFLEEGTPEERINGYKTKTVNKPVPDIPVSDRSGNQPVTNGDLLVNPDLPIPDLPTTEEEEGREAAAPPSIHPSSLPEVLLPSLNGKDFQSNQTATAPSPPVADPPSSPPVEVPAHVAAYQDILGLTLSPAHRDQILGAAPPLPDWLVTLRVWKLADYNPMNVDGMLELAKDPRRARWKLNQLEKGEDTAESYQVDIDDVEGPGAPATPTKPLDPETDLFARIDEKRWIVSGPKRGQVRDALRRGVAYDALKALIDNAGQFAEVLDGISSLAVAA